MTTSDPIAEIKQAIETIRENTRVPQPKYIIIRPRDVNPNYDLQMELAAEMGAEVIESKNLPDGASAVTVDDLPMFNFWSHKI